MQSHVKHAENFRQGGAGQGLSWTSPESVSVLKNGGPPPLKSKMLIFHIVRPF